MFSLKPAFDRASETRRGIDSLTLLFWAVAIDDDRQERERKRRRKREAFRQAQRRSRPASAPKPF